MRQLKDVERLLRELTTYYTLQLQPGTIPNDVENRASLAVFLCLEWVLSFDSNEQRIRDLVHRELAMFPPSGPHNLGRRGNF